MIRGNRQDARLSPHLLAVAGGMRGVGATTLAVNLAVALAQQGQRTVVIDADASGGTVARVCGISPTSTIADVLAGKRSIHEVLVRGPGGTQIVAGAHGPPTGERAVSRLSDQLAALGRHTDAVVIDLGTEPSELMARLCGDADRLLVIATAAEQAVLDAYALIKTLSAGDSPPGYWSLAVNRVTSKLAAEEVHGRLDRSCQRFLSVSVDFAGWVPVVPAAGHDAAGWMLRPPGSPAVTLIEGMALRLLKRGDDSAQHAA